MVSAAEQTAVVVVETKPAVLEHFDSEQFVLAAFW